MEDEFNTLPLIPSPQGRGDLRYLAALLRGSSFSKLYKNLTANRADGVLYIHLSKEFFEALIRGILTSPPP
ncbi:MAG: hypothetical protein WA126_15015 [Thermodesulfovibrionales bacterium]